MSLRVLITGAAGFLGRYVSLAFKRAGASTCGIGHGAYGKEELSLWGVDEWAQTDVTVDTLEGIGGKFDVIAHCAGSGSVGFSFLHPMEDFQKTVESTLNVLEFMRRSNPEARLIYPSSPAAQGDGNGTPLRETDPCTPESPYGVHKKIAEELCRSYANVFGLHTTIVRFFSIYGEGLRKQLLWDACNKMLHGEPEACFWGTGEEVRDWIHVEDAASLVVFLSQASSKVTLINGGLGIPYTIRDTLHLLRQSLGISCALRFNMQTKTGDPKYYCADTTRLTQLQWKAAISLDTGLARYARWVKEQI